MPSAGNVDSWFTFHGICRYAGRVHLIMGNRDINKIRLLQELSPEHVARYPLDRLPKPYWLRAGNQSALEDLQQDLGTDKVADTLPNRLRYILKRTMGAGLAFELRRASIGKNADDDAVVESFVNSMRPGGLIRGYLERAKLGLIIGDTLFVHGGISADTLGWLPPPQTQPEPDARRWIAKLNAFAESQIRRLPTFDTESAAENDQVCPDGHAWSFEGGYTGRGAEDLMQ